MLSPTILNKHRKQNTRTTEIHEYWACLLRLPSTSFSPPPHPLQHPHWPCLTPQSMISLSYLHTNINIITAIPWKQRPPKGCHVVNIVYKLHCIGYTWLLATPPRIFPISRARSHELKNFKQTGCVCIGRWLLLG